HTAWRHAHGVNLVERALSAEVGEATVTDDYRVTSSREARLEAVRLLADRISASTEDLMAAVVATSAGPPRASSDMLTRLGDPTYGLELFDPRYPALGGYVVPLAGKPAADVGTRVIPMDDPGMPRLVREIAVAELVRAWAVSANGTTRSLAIQEVAGQQFATGPVRDSPIPDEWRPTIEQAVQEHGAVLREFLQAQYELTQQRLAERGVTELVLYRGFQWPGADRPEWASATAGSVVPLPPPRPLSAWTSSLSVAIDWTLGAGETATVISTRVPAEAVLSIELTGFGCLWQQEFVVVARPMYARLEAVRDAGTLDVAHGWPADSHLDPSGLEQAGHIMRGLPSADRVQLLTAVGVARPAMGGLMVELRTLVAGMPGVGFGAPEVRSLASLAEAYDIERRATGATVDDFLASQTDLIQIPLTVPSSQRADLLNRLAAHGYSVTDGGDRLSVIAPNGTRFELGLSEVDS
ncbi:MAG TPA: hypothetical protein VK028_14360, partial [Micromonosporaceae bacterium]|nr:hypothetical protein [Micromonosporaceae bacterium]